MIVQFEGAKRTLTFIFGKHRGDPDDDVFVSNTSGDFDPAPADDDELDDDGESELFGFRPQRVTATLNGQRLVVVGGPVIADDGIITVYTAPDDPRDPHCLT